MAFCFKGEIAPARVGEVPARACSEALGGLMGLGEALGEEWALPESYAGAKGRGASDGTYATALEP